MKLLIIEDERELSSSIASFLITENYLCEQAFTFNEALEKISLYTYDCVLLDLTLPGGNGLKTGADDYLPKPFHLAELSIRIYALIRRRHFLSNNVIRSRLLYIITPGASVNIIF